MERTEIEAWAVRIGYYSINSLSGNPLLKSDIPWEGPRIYKAEMDYIFYGLEEQDINEIQKEIKEYNITFVEGRIRNKKGLANVIMRPYVEPWVRLYTILWNEISYNDIIEIFKEQIPFLQQDVKMLIKYVEKRGVTVTDKPADYDKGLKYSTEEERREARKKSRNKYQRKKNLPNEYNIEKTLEIAEMDPYKYVSSEIDISKYI